MSDVNENVNLITRLKMVEKTLLEQAKGSEAAPEYYYAEVCHRAAERIEQLEQRWIPVSERLPKPTKSNGMAILYEFGHVAAFGEQHPDYFRYIGKSVWWMPLPPPPAEPPE